MKNYYATLISKNDLSDTIKLYKFEKPADFTYKSGQFISLKINDVTRRSYSLASFHKNDYISLIADVSPMGVGSKFLLNLNIGDNIEFFGPLGNLVFPANYIEYSAINFICSGVGIAPFCGMLEDLKYSSYLHNVTLLYSEKYEKDFVDLNEYPAQLSFIKTLTRDKNDAYLQGRVTEHLEKLVYNKALFYICGNLEMIKDVIAGLESKKVDKKSIIVESFYINEK